MVGVLCALPFIISSVFIVRILADYFFEKESDGMS